MKIVLAGGGTLGSVSPLVAVWQVLSLRDHELEALFIGTPAGPEKEFLTQYPQIKFKVIPAGKLRRYLSWENLLIPFLTLAGFLKAFFILIHFKPNAIISAGGFVAVPVIFAGKLLGIKIIIHQLDLEPTLSNILVKKITNVVTVSFAKSLADFSSCKPILVGSLIREEARKITEQKNAKPIVLFLGGGTGALALNKLSIATAPLFSDVEFWQITGKNKQVLGQKLPVNFKFFDFLNKDYFQKISQADLVITRAGLSSLMELSYFGKPSIIIPLPQGHQEVNARYFTDRGGGLYLAQNELTPRILADTIKILLSNTGELEKLSNNISKIIEHGGENKVADLI